MKRFTSTQKVLFRTALVLTLVIFGSQAVPAQSRLSLSVDYDLLPYQELDALVIDTVTGTDTTFLENPQVQLRKLRASLSYPLIFSEGRTVLVNDLSYQLIGFSYRRLEHPLERLHSASYTLMVQHRLSLKWSVWALGTPSLASDLEADISEDDFNFQAAAVFIRHFSERLSLGLGAAYSTQFGSAQPVPVVALDWNNGRNLMAKAILPVSFEFWYRPGQRLDLGLLVSGDGNNFHGDPEIYQVVNPELRYTMLTVGPAARISIFDRVRLNVEGGVIALHRFEFFDNDNEVASYDLKPSGYVRVGLQYGS